MCSRAGLKTLRCEECGREEEVEVGITTKYCHAKPMVEVVEEEEPADVQPEHPEEEVIRLTPDPPAEG